MGYSHLLIGISVILCLPRTASEPTDGLRRQCGHITCDITYQYCNEGLLGTIPVCSLCDDICGPNRVGREEVFIQYCLETCPVYWYRQLQTTKPTTSSGTPSAGPSTVSPDVNQNSSVPIWLILILLLCVLSTLVLASILAVIVHRQRRRRQRRSRSNQSIVRSKTDLSLVADSGLPNDTSKFLLEYGDIESCKKYPIRFPDRHATTSTTGLATESQTQTETTESTPEIQRTSRTSRQDRDVTHVRRLPEDQADTDRMVTAVGSGTFVSCRTSLNII